MHPEKEHLLAKLDAARARLDAAIRQMDARTSIYPHWNLKELLDHIIGWDELVIKQLMAHARSQSPEAVVFHGIDAYNAESVKRRAGLSLEASRRDYEQQRAAFRQTILDMPAERLSLPMRLPWGQTGTASDVVDIFAHHEHEHSGDLEKIIAGLAK